MPSSYVSCCQDTRPERRMAMTKTLYTHVDIEIPRPADGVDRRHRLRHRHRLAQRDHRDDPLPDGPPHVGTNVREVLQLGGRDTSPTPPSPRSARHELPLRRRPAPAASSAAAAASSRPPPPTRRCSPTTSNSNRIHPAASPARFLRGGCNTACAATCAGCARSSPAAHDRHSRRGRGGCSNGEKYVADVPGRSHLRSQ